MILGVVQARMGSTRLRGKVMKPILGKPVLAIIIDRLKHCSLLNKIVIATTNKTEDKIILDFAERYGIDSYAGSEMDIVDRMYQTAKRFGADAIVRITADCPLVDPKLVDEIIQIYFENPEADFISNTIIPSYPDGLDVELFPIKTLEFLWYNVKSKFFREWIAGYILAHPDRFKIINKKSNEDLSSYRLTLDYEEDYQLICKIFEKLGSRYEIFYLEDVIDLLRREPDLIKINQKYIRNEAYLNYKTFSKIMQKIQKSKFIKIV